MAGKKKMPMKKGMKDDMDKKDMPGKKGKKPMFGKKPK